MKAGAHLFELVWRLAEPDGADSAHQAQKLVCVLFARSHMEPRQLHFLRAHSTPSLIKQAARKQARGAAISPAESQSVNQPVS